MVNATNMPRKDNPRWGISNAIETIRPPKCHLSPPPSAIIGTGCGRVVAWLIGLPRRAGRRLFAGNDAEAGWRHWQVTERRGGLARSYRDPRFDLLASPRQPGAAKPGDGAA